ncbi:MAG: hypothetical protein KAR20_13635, partial [Candidatus Heimdallarchaeota archaeon]|nr:hypothetical protein [Candidatus Heimdallarchaeota archaeon]
NMQIFISHYLGVRLFPYQDFWIYLLSHSSKFAGLASRASAKSWLIGLYSIAKCVLYPRSAISLSSSTKAQAGLIISQKIQGLYDEFPNIRREIKHIVSNQNVYSVTFHNGSKIFVVIAKDSGRGNRATDIVLEERRLIPTEVIDTIIRPFLVARQPPYLKLPEYSNIPPEEPSEIIITSVHYKSGDWYREADKLLRLIAKGSSDVKAIFLDFLISIRHGIKTRKQMVLEKNTADPVGFGMEFQNLPFGGSTRSFYKTEFFNRDLKTPFIPRTKGLNWVGKNKYGIKRQPGEIRLMSCDIASRAGSKNDISTTFLWRLRPTKKGYFAEIPYIEAFSGMNSTIQANRIKELFAEWSDFTEGDALILDVLNLGIGILDNLGKVTKAESSDVEYPAITVIEHESIEDKVYEELYNRTFANDALPFVYPFSASAKLNGLMASSLRDRLKKKLFSFLVNEREMEEQYIKKGIDDILSHEPWIKAHLLAPSIQTNLLVNESVSLELSMTGGGQHIKLTEMSGMLKDRFTSLAMGNYYVGLLDQELLKEGDDGDSLDAYMGAFGLV